MSTTNSSIKILWSCEMINADIFHYNLSSMMFQLTWLIIAKNRWIYLVENCIIKFCEFWQVSRKCLFVEISLVASLLSYEFRLFWRLSFQRQAKLFNRLATTVVCLNYFLHGFREGWFRCPNSSRETLLMAQHEHQFAIAQHGENKHTHTHSQKA